MFKFKRIRGGLRSLRKATAWKFRISECRVGIVGLGYSGKTVLLTSLINHLQDHDPCRFRLGRDRKVDLRKFEELPVVGSWGRFDYKRHRDRLVQGHLKWVDKTKDCVQYVCQFERSDWHNHVIKIKLFDLPGERVADAIMAGMDYAKWSDRMLGIMDSDQEYKDYCGWFLQVLDS